MKYLICLFEKYGDKKPEAEITSGTAPLEFERFSLDKGKNIYKRFGRPIDWKIIKSRIKVNYYLNINANENTTRNQRPKRV